jgi:MarR family transcriptional regulator, organic hydroperoxide resistance regulator
MLYIEEAAYKYGARPLWSKARKKLRVFSLHEERLNEFIFADLDDRGLGDITGKLTMLKNRLEKASLRFAAEI